MNIIKPYKHISDNTATSKVKKYSGGGAECNYKGPCKVHGCAPRVAVTQIIHDKNAQNYTRTDTHRAHVKPGEAW